MRLEIVFIHNKKPTSSTIEINPDIYVRQLKTKIIYLLKSEDILPSSINNMEDIILSYNGIEMQDMFKISRFKLRDGAQINLQKVEVKKKVNDPESPATCSLCGKRYDDPCSLRYHPGKLAPYEWVYGITTLWQWSCCDKIISTPEACYHPEGCLSGICPDCRRDCACYEARLLREKELEDF